MLAPFVYLLGMAIVITIGAVLGLYYAKQEREALLRRRSTKEKTPEGGIAPGVTQQRLER